MEFPNLCKGLSSDIIWIFQSDIYGHNIINYFTMSQLHVSPKHNNINKQQKLDRNQIDAMTYLASK